MNGHPLKEPFGTPGGDVHPIEKVKTLAPKRPVFSNVKEIQFETEQ